MGGTMDDLHGFLRRLSLELLLHARRLRLDTVDAEEDTVGRQKRSDTNKVLNVASAEPINNDEGDFHEETHPEMRLSDAQEEVRKSTGIRPPTGPD